MSKILLSICIPTNGRIDILRNTLDSIFSQEIDFTEIEVILSDNSKTDELPLLLRQYSNIPNIVYEKTVELGFMNSINALRMGNGELLKLHNNYTEFKSDTLGLMLEVIRKFKTEKPPIFFTDGFLKESKIKEFRNFDEFIFTLSYFSSWSTGFSIWKSDFQNGNKIEYNQMFPHTTLLFSLHSKKKYVVYDIVLFHNQTVKNKGGYNLFDTFAVQYLKMLDDMFVDNHISKETFEFIKTDLYNNFLTVWYCNIKILKNDYTFDMTDLKKSMLVYYSALLYYKMVFIAYFRAFKNQVKITLNLRR